MQRSVKVSRARAQRIVENLVRLGLDATEAGQLTLWREAVRARLARLNEELLRPNQRLMELVGGGGGSLGKQPLVLFISSGVEEEVRAQDHCEAGQMQMEAVMAKAGYELALDKLVAQEEEAYARAGEALRKRWARQTD